VRVRLSFTRRGAASASAVPTRGRCACTPAFSVGPSPGLRTASPDRALAGERRRRRKMLNARAPSRGQMGRVERATARHHTTVQRTCIDSYTQVRAPGATAPGRR